MGGSQRVRPAHFFVADKCLNVFLSKKNVFKSIMQTFAQSNCVFTPRFALTYKYLA